MRLSVIILIGCLAAITNAQINVGPGGVTASPINLLTVFK